MTGTVFELTPGGALTTLLSFTGANGANPKAALLQGNNGNLYGATVNGGSPESQGAVFDLTLGLPAKKTQTLTFPVTGSTKVGQTVTLAATSTSGLPITYSILPTAGYTGTATISGNQITFTGAGNIKLAADQPGNSIYAAAAQKRQNVVIKAQ